ncbi:hypothetical protein [Dipodfec virus UOA04_Rod_720]|nr:hypothetical protein [Dipodfec virus UOA04_Rod_720]
MFYCHFVVKRENLAFSKFVSSLSREGVSVFARVADDAPCEFIVALSSKENADLALDFVTRFFAGDVEVL